MTLSAVPTTVDQSWAGALTDSGFRVQADLQTTQNAGVQTNVVVAAAADTGFSNVLKRTTPTVATTTAGSAFNFYTAKHTVTGLQANTAYRWAIETNGVRRAATVDGALTGNNGGLVRTAPTQGTPAAFSFCIGSCSNFASDRGGNFSLHNTTCQSLENIAVESNCLFFLHTGDLIYDDNISGSLTFKRSNATFVRCFRGSPSGKALCAAMPVMYTWSDHDSTNNDSTLSTSGYAAQITASTTVYQELVPHFDLTTGTLGIAQSWWIGTCFFIMPDCYSFRDTAGSPPPMLGTTQKAWITSQVTAAVGAGATLIFLVSSPTWGNSFTLGWNPTWAVEQTAVLDALKAIPGIPGIFVLEGDDHGSGVDDGTHTDFSTGGGMKIARVLSSGLKMPSISMIGDQTIRWKGVDSMDITNSRNYARIDVNAANTGVIVTLKGRTSGDGSFSTYGTYATADLAAWGA
jgi:hypothetical protein